MTRTTGLIAAIMRVPDDESPDIVVEVVTSGDRTPIELTIRGDQARWLLPLLHEAALRECAIERSLNGVVALELGFVRDSPTPNAAGHWLAVPTVQLGQVWLLVVDRDLRELRDAIDVLLQSSDDAARH